MVREHDAATVLTRPQWIGLEAAHHERVDALLRGHLDRTRPGKKHPVEDFLFTYYSLRPAPAAATSRTTQSRCAPAPTPYRRSPTCSHQPAAAVMASSLDNAADISNKGTHGDMTS